MKETVPQSSKRIEYGYNHPILNLNIMDKNYLCVSRDEEHLDPRTSISRVCIGEHWKNFIFQHGEPVIIAADFFEFLKLAKDKYKGIRGLFSLSYPLRVTATYDKMVPFFLYFLIQTQERFDLNEREIKIILKKTNERFWIWDNFRMGLSYDLFTALKKEIGPIPEEDLIYKGKDKLCLPFEYLLLLYWTGKVSKEELLEKIISLKPQLIGMSIIQLFRSGLETLLNDPRVLKDFNGTDIDAHDDILPLIEQDELLNSLFIERKDTKDLSWIEDKMDQVKKLMRLMRIYDLDSHDPFPSLDEFEVLNELFYDKDQEKVLTGLLNGERISFHELDFFKEYHDKINITLVNYISCKLKLEGMRT